MLAYARLMLSAPAYDIRLVESVPYFTRYAVVNAFFNVTRRGPKRGFLTR